MKHDARSVANEIIRHAQDDGKSVTHLQVQKLVYYCHAWMLGLYGEPLLKQPVEAWEYGPVIRDLLVSLRQYGRGPVTQMIDYPAERGERFDERQEDMIRQVWEKYGHLSGGRLSEMTHRVGSPWYRVWHRAWFSRWAKSPTIPNERIREYYARIARSE